MVDVTDAVAARRRLEGAETAQKKLVEELNATNARLNEANKELQDANDELQAANEELMLAQEELQATNEEFEATNEELQATNEELETNNEELQATNEELDTTNDELQARTGELAETATLLGLQRERLAEIIEKSPFPVAVLRGKPPVLELFNHLFAGIAGRGATVGRGLEDALAQLPTVAAGVRAGHGRRRGLDQRADRGGGRERGPPGLRLHGGAAARRRRADRESPSTPTTWPGTGRPRPAGARRRSADRLAVRRTIGARGRRHLHPLAAVGVAAGVREDLAHDVVRGVARRGRGLGQPRFLHRLLAPAHEHDGAAAVGADLDAQPAVEVRAHPGDRPLRPVEPQRFASSSTRLTANGAPRLEARYTSAFGACSSDG